MRYLDMKNKAARGPAENKRFTPPGEPEVDATDAARDLAKDAGIDLSTVKGTGADGRITKGDVEAAIEAGKA